MKNILFFLFLLIFPLNAYSLSCVFPDKFDAKNIFLFKINEMENVETDEQHTLKIAHGDVLMIYKGDVEELSKTRQITVSIYCDDIWDPECSIYPHYSADNRYFVFSDGLYINHAICEQNAFPWTEWLQKEIEEKLEPVWARNL